LNNNPFKSKQTSDSKNEKLSIDICSNSYDIGEDKAAKLSTKEKSLLVFNALKHRFKKVTGQAVEKVTNPIISESHKATTFLLAEKKAFYGDLNSDVYQLLNLLSHNDNKISLKASRRLELKLNEPSCRAIILNYFKFNTTAKSKFSRLYNALSDFED